MKVTRLFDHPVWVTQAACGSPDVDAEIFFPTKGRETTAEAKAICGGCSVRMLCLTHALIHHIEHGVLGGCSPRERQALNRRKAAA
jgi:WhiB family redox-sensing transcriptional regulator